MITYIENKIWQPFVRLSGRDWRPNELTDRHQTWHEPKRPTGVGYLQGHM